MAQTTPSLDDDDESSDADAKPLTETQLKAVALVVADDLSDEDIAKAVGVGRSTLARWKKYESFKAACAKTIEESEKTILNVPIAQRRRRVDALQDRWRKMKRVIEARTVMATDDEGRVIPGGDTGLLVKQYRGIGHGESFTMVEEYAVDTGLLREMRELEKQAAQEVGQWIDKLAPVNPDGTAEFTGLTKDERVAGLAAILGVGVARLAEEKQTHGDDSGEQRD